MFVNTEKIAAIPIAANDFSSYFAHTTRSDILHSILNDGKVKRLSTLVKDRPDMQISVEPYKSSKKREMLQISDAINALQKNKKEVDRVFLTQGGYDPAYGDAVILKPLKSPKKYHRFTFIPEEHTIRRDLSVRNAKIYVHDDKYDEFRERFNQYDIQPLSTIPIKRFSLYDKLLTLPQLIKTSASALPLPVRELPRSAFLSGSQALGLSIDNSDVDIFIPFKREGAYLRAIENIRNKYPSLTQGKYSADKLDKTVLTGNVNGVDVDVVFAHGDKATNFKNAFEKAKTVAQDEMFRQKVIDKKQRLKNAIFFPKTRYKLYKNYIAEELGLKEHFF